MARAQMLFAVHARDSAGVFDLHHSLLEEPLASTCQNDGLSVGLRQRGVGLHLAQFMFFPLDKPDGRSDRRVFGNPVAQDQVARLCTQQIDQRCCESIWNPG